MKDPIAAMQKATGANTFKVIWYFAALISTVAIIMVAPALQPMLGAQTAHELPVDFEQIIVPRSPLVTTRPNTSIKRIAHRGASKLAPENTLAAITIALDMGAEYVEIDTRISADGIPVLLHDMRVYRTTNGNGTVADYSLVELQKLDAGTWFSPEFAGTRIPSLEEALQLISGRACIVWDTKALPTAEMVQLFQNYGFGRECLLINCGDLGESGENQCVKALAKLWPEAPLMPYVRNINEISDVLSRYPNARAVNVVRLSATNEFVDAAHKAGLLVASTTLAQSDNPKFYGLLMESGADLLMLDNLEDFKLFLGDLEQ